MYLHVEESCVVSAQIHVTDYNMVWDHNNARHPLRQQYSYCNTQLSQHREGLLVEIRSTESSIIVHEHIHRCQHNCSHSLSQCKNHLLLFVIFCAYRQYNTKLYKYSKLIAGDLLQSIEIHRMGDL